MAELARKHDQVAPPPTDSPDQAEVQAPIPYWQRQPGEPLFWYNRFKRYRNLGYKRSLQAAVEQERAQITALKSTKVEEKPAALPSSKVVKGRKQPASTQLVEVPKPRLVQVPGSWRQASIQWRWVERAAAYDEYRIDKMVEKSIDDLLDGPAVAFNRVMMLKTLLEHMRVNLNSNAKHMSLEQFCMMVQRMQSLTKQIADEMASYDETITRALLRHISIPIYQEWEPPSTKADYEKIIEQTGGPEKAVQAIKQEQARRRGKRS